MKFYIVRHGETDWNKVTRWQGNKETSLNDLGIHQANMLADRLKGIHIDHIFSSPLKRAAKTAEIIKDKTNVNLTYFDGLKEIRLGDWEGFTTDEIKINYENLFIEWETNEHAQVGLSVENYYDLQKRAYSALIELCSMDYENILLVAHGTWIRVLICKLLSIPLNRRTSFEVNNTGLSLIEYDKTTCNFKVLKLNDLSHYNK